VQSIQFLRKEKQMSQQQQAATVIKSRGLSIDTWAVLLAFALAALVRAGVFKHIPW
jgi:transcription elongation factor